MKLLQLTGNIGLVKQLKSDYTVCSLAVTEKKKASDGSYEDLTTWFNVYWKNADFPKYNTGDLVTVIGSFKQTVFSSADGIHKIQTDVWPTYQRRVIAKRIEESDLPE